LLNQNLGNGQTKKGRSQPEQGGEKGKTKGNHHARKDNDND